jgi:uncharacterized protein
MNHVTDNVAERRFELQTGEGIAHADYELGDGVITFTHTEVPEAARGKGIGQRLIEGALADARARQLRVVPECSFFAIYLRRHPDAATLA